MELNPRAAPAPPRGGRSWNGLILVWLACYLALGVRTLVLDDARYGFGMFSKQVNYEIDYFWVLDGGRTTPMTVKADLKGEARHTLGAGRGHRTRYGSGMVRHAVGSYLRYRMKASEAPPLSGPPPAEAIAAGAKIIYTVNYSDEFLVEEIIHPAVDLR